MQTNEDVKKEMRDMNVTEGTLIDEIPADSLDVEITDDATVVVKEELQEMNISQATLIDEMLPFDSLDVKLVDTANEVVKEELQDPNITEGTFVDEMLPSDTFEEKSAVSADEDAVEELQDINITEDDAIEGVEEMLQDISINESAFIDEFAPSNPLGVELTSDEAEETMEDSKKEEPIVEEEVSLPLSKQVSDMELENTMDQNPDDGFLQVNDENAQDELQKVETQDPSKGDTKDLMPSSIVE
ncbi:hypothetical protein Tco_0558939 [Tanacetum coccineum]